MISLLLAVGLGLPSAAPFLPQTNIGSGPVAVQPQLDRSPGCGATNARENNDRTPILGGPGAIQHVFVTPGTASEDRFHVAYSAKTNAGSIPCTKRVNNALISVFKLTPFDRSGSDILIYGTGYGTRYLNGSPCNGAQYRERGARIDAENVSRIVRQCLNLRGTVRVDVVVPHSHADHINPEFLHELEALNFKVQAIMTHADDYGATRNVDVSITAADPNTSRWGSLRDLIQPYGTKASVPCLQTVCTKRVEDSPLFYLTELGPAWMRERGGHTPGASDLVLDVGGDASKRILVYGSSPPGTGPSTTANCMAPSCSTNLSGVLETFLAHGNVRY